MNTRMVNASLATLAVVAMLSGAMVSAHHSFAMYDQNKVVTMTGVMKQYVPQANHAELHFYSLAPDHKGLAMANGKPVEWGVEMAGTAQMERQGINSTTFVANNTVFSVKLNPLRDGSNFGARVGAIAKCPTDATTKKPVLPAAGKHCDSVAGHTLIGGTTF